MGDKTSIKTFDQLEVRDHVYKVEFLWNRFIIVGIRQIEYIEKDKYGKTTLIEYNRYGHFITAHLNTDTTNINNTFFTDINEFMHFFKIRIAEAKKAAKESPTFGLQRYMKVIKNIKEVEKEVKDAIYNNLLIHTQRSIYF